MNVITTRLIQISLLGALLIVALGINYVIAWTGPTQTPAPNGNTLPPVNVGTIGQAKDGPLSVGNSLAATTTLGFSVIGRSYITGWLRVGAAGNATQPIDLMNAGANKGIRFPDGTVQSTAYTPSSPNVAKKFCPMVDPNKSFPTPQYLRCGTAAQYTVYTFASLNSSEIKYKDPQNQNGCSAHYNPATGAYLYASGCTPELNCLQSLTTIAADSLNRCDL